MFSMFGTSHAGHAAAAAAAPVALGSVRTWDSAKKGPNSSLIHHVDYWKVHWGTNFPSNPVKEALIKVAFIQRSNLSSIISELNLESLSANDLKDLYDLLNGHALFGGEDRPEGGQLAKDIKSELRNKILALAHSDLSKAEQVLQALDQSPKSDLGELKTCLALAIEQNVNPMLSESELAEAWEDVKSSSLPNRGLLGHTEWHLLSQEEWNQKIDLRIKNLLLQAAQLSTSQELNILTTQFSRLSPKELVTLYQVLNSHAKRGINQHIDGQFARALIRKLENYFVETLPGENRIKAGHVIRLLHALKGQNLEPLRDNMLSKLNLVLGPYGGIYTKDYWQQMNAYQGKVMTPEVIGSKGDANEWRQMERNYGAFMRRVENTQGIEAAPKIPKKIHLIWLGKEPDDTTKAVRDSWIEHHKPEWDAHGWEVKLWGNEDAAALIAEMRQIYPMVGEVWDKAVDDKGKIVYAEKADVLRYCILHKFGGLYADSDLPGYDTVADLHYLTDFYVSMEQNDHPHCIYVGNALIGAKPNHPLIKNCLEKMKPRQKGEDGWAIIGRTGPGLITDQIYTGLRQDKATGTTDTLVLGPSYFYPLPSGKKDEARGKPEVAESCLSPWSKGLHLWNLSWAKEV